MKQCCPKCKNTTFYVDEEGDQCSMYYVSSVTLICSKCGESYQVEHGDIDTPSVQTSLEPIKEKMKQ